MLSELREDTEMGQCLLVSTRIYNRNWLESIELGNFCMTRISSRIGNANFNQSSSF